MRLALTLALILLAALAAYVRLAPNDPAHWAVDPVAVGTPGLRNGFLIRPADGDAAAPVYPVSPAALARRIDAVARAWPRTRLFAGDPASGHMTYITRTRVWGFPDFTSVAVLPAPGGATFAAFARARFGESDFGVNRARLQAWLKALS